MKAKFQVQDLLGIGLTLVVLGVALAYGIQVLGDVKTDLSTSACDSNSSLCSVEYNATADAVTGVSKIPEKLPTIATVVVAAVIIGILVTYLWQRFQ